MGVLSLAQRALMQKHILGKRYIVYDASTLTFSPTEARMLLATDDQYEAIQYARDRGATATVYAYDKGAGGALTHPTFVYHLAHFGANV